MDHYQRGLKICEEIGANKFISNALSGIGGIYGEQGNFPKAHDYFMRSLKVLEEIGAEASGAVLLYNIGDLYFGQKDYKTAIIWCEKASANSSLE